MENHHFNGKIQYRWQFSIDMLNHQRLSNISNMFFPERVIIKPAPLCRPSSVGRRTVTWCCRRSWASTLGELRGCWGGGESVAWSRRSWHSVIWTPDIPGLFGGNHHKNSSTRVYVHLWCRSVRECIAVHFFHMGPTSVYRCMLWWFSLKSTGSLGKSKGFQRCGFV